MGHIQEATLHIWLGIDNLFRLNLKQLLISEVKPELEKELSLRDTVGVSDQYPSRMGLFLMDLKLHFSRLEKLNRATEYTDNYLNSLPNFNLPSLAPNTSTPFTDFGYFGKMFRPIVFTISDKVYALVTDLFTRNPKIPFRVLEPEVGVWRSLPPPPLPVISSLKSHCVFQNNLLVQTSFGDYIFYANEGIEKWEPFDKLDKLVDSKICALLEYKDHILVLNRGPFKLVAYESASFDSSPSPDGVVLGIDLRYTNFGELNISWASFNIIENNYICLVFISTHNFHVSVFRFIPKDVRYGTYAFVEAYKEFDIPRECNPDYQYYSTLLSCTKYDEESPTAVSQLDTNRDRYLYISLGYDNLFSLNFNDLCSGKDKLDLKLLFTNCNRRAEFPIGMGLFFWDSKLHFFGGENLEEGKYVFSDLHRRCFQQLHKLMGLDNDVRPKYGPQGHGSKNYKIKCGEEWGNKKVRSLNLPEFTLVNNSTLIPDHSSCKFRPLVFTISNKVYALSIRPLSVRFPYIDQDDREKNLFEVYDLVENKWRDLKDPHPELCKLIRNGALCIRSQCVFRNKVLLQTNWDGDYLFKASGDSGDWARVDGQFPSIWAGVEYNDKFVLVLTKHPNELVAYESASFGETNSTPPTKLYIYNNVIDFSKISEAASLQLVDLDHNLINLVFVSPYDKKIRVMVFKVEIPLQYAVVEVYRLIDIPKEFHGFYLRLNSTFIWQSDVIQQDDTINKRKKKRVEPDTE